MVSGTEPLFPNVHLPPTPSPWAPVRLSDGLNLIDRHQIGDPRMRIISFANRWISPLNSSQPGHGSSLARTTAIFLMLLAHSLLALAVQTGTTERLTIIPIGGCYNAPESDATANTQAREVSSSNFEVLGIHLADGMFSQAAAKLGAATIIERGDASTGRQQACYVSAQDGTKVHLIFERGEVDFTYYLFVDGPDWDGSDRCVRTNLISRSLATASGVHLGQTPSQVIAILGPPSRRGKDELIYSLNVRKKTLPKS